MIKYLSIDKFLELVSEKGVVTDIRKIDKLIKEQ